MIEKSFDNHFKEYHEWIEKHKKKYDYYNKYREFCGIKASDSVIDFACGSGDFLIDISSKISKGLGLDSAQHLINYAIADAKENKIKNIEFLNSKIEDLNLDKKYDIAVCRMAFHHFHTPQLIIKKMCECCKDNGKIAIQDMISNEEVEVQVFFEKLERLIDNSHSKILSKNYFINLFQKNNIKITKETEMKVESCLEEYLNHSSQSEENKVEIDKLIFQGLQDKKISNYFKIKIGKIFIKKKIFLMVGEKIT